MMSPRQPSGTAAHRETERAAAVVVTDVGRWWWLWVVAGVLWILVSFFILQFGHAAVTTVGLLIGIMLLAAGVQEVIVASFAGGWRWLWYIFGALLLLGGLWALFNPTQTFLAVASALGFLFLLIGVFWIVEAFATRALNDPLNDLWWLGLIAGIIMIALGFWVSGQFLVTKAYELLIFAGIWALLHGITDIVKGFQIKRRGHLPAAVLVAL